MSQEDNSGTERLHFGTATYGVPSADTHYLSINYGLLVESPSSEVEVNIVNSEGEVIDKQAPDRTLSNTIQDGTNFSSREQFRNAIYNDNVQVNQETFTLTQAESRYINNNYGAYVTYEAEGQTTLLLFRTPLTATDSASTNITWDPFVPQKGTETTFTAQNVDSGVVPQWKIEKPNGGSLVGTGEEITKTLSDKGEYTVTVQLGEEQITRKLTVTNEYQDTAASFDISYTLTKPINSKYGTIDVNPLESFSVPVTITNNGDADVERKITMIDTLKREQLSMLDEQNRDYGSYTNKVVSERTVNVEPHSEKTVYLSTSWKGYQYGNHVRAEPAAADRRRADGAFRHFLDCSIPAPRTC